MRNSDQICEEVDCDQGRTIWMQVESKREAPSQDLLGIFCGILVARKFFFFSTLDTLTSSVWYRGQL